MSKIARNEQITFLENLRKMKGQQPMERKESKQKKVIDQKPSSSTKHVNEAAKRMSSRIEAINEAKRKKFEDKPCSSRTQVVDVNQASPIVGKIPTLEVKIEQTREAQFLENEEGQFAEIATSSNTKNENNQNSEVNVEVKVGKNMKKFETPKKAFKLNWPPKLMAKMNHTGARKTKERISGSNAAINVEGELEGFENQVVLQEEVGSSEGTPVNVLEDPSVTVNNPAVEDNQDQQETIVATPSNTCAQPKVQKKRALTNNGEWCAFGASELFYDYNKGVRFPASKIKENFSKLMKNNRCLSADSWFEKAELYHGVDEKLEELCAANAFVSMMINQKFVGSFRKPTTLKTTVGFDRNLVSEEEATVRLPSGIDLNILDILSDDNFIHLLISKDADGIAQKITLAVGEQIGKQDPYCCAYSCPRGKRALKFVSLGTSVQATIAKVTAAGLGWDETQQKSGLLRLQGLCRGTLENFLNRYRIEFATVNGNGKAEIVADYLKGEIEKRNRTSSENEGESDSEHVEEGDLPDQ